MIRFQRFVLWLVVALTVGFAIGCASNPSKTAQPVRPTVPTTPQIIIGFGTLATVPPPTIIAPTIPLVVMPANPVPFAEATVPLLSAPAASTPMFPSVSVIDTATDPNALPLGPGCDNAQAQITYPRDGQAFTWGTTIPVTGTANVDDFLFYKIQFIPDASYTDPLKHDAWGELYANEKNPKKMSAPPKPVIDGRLMEWQTKTITRGTYYIRLLATRSNGQYGDNPCRVKIIVR